jgi:hypothetical protein
MTIINQLTSFKLSGITFSGTSQQLNYTAGVTTGSVIANKALVVDTNKDLIGSDNTTRIRNLTLSGAMTAISYTGTLLTSNQPNITSVGSLNNLTVTNNLSLPGHNGIDTGLMLSGNLVLANAHQLNSTVVTPGTAEANKALVLDGSRIINNIHSITSQHMYLSNLYINNVEVTSSATELNYLDIISIGQGEASKALVLDSNRNINNINNLTTNTLTATNLNVTNLSGTLQTSSQPNITSVGTLTSLTLTGSITGVTNLGTNQITLNGTLLTPTPAEINRLSGITVTTAELNYLDINAPGTVDANKALVVDNNRNLSNLNQISLNGSNDVITLTNFGSGNRTNIRFINDVKSWELGSRASGNTNPNSFYLYDNQVNQYRLIVNSAGSVNIVNHNGSSSGLQLNGTLVTATAAELNRLSGITATTAELNYLDITTEGQGQASKALILDSNRNINNINVLASVQFNTNSASATSINNSTVTSNYDLYLRRNNVLDGNSHGIAFMHTTNDPSITQPGASILFTRVTSTSGHLSFNTTQTERFRITSSGNIGINTTNPDLQLEINSSTGNCLRLTNNDSDGSAINFSNFTVSNTGQLTISPSSNNSLSSAGDIILRGSVIIGKDSTNNILRFNGTTGDANTHMTVIAERIYGGTEQSELLLFKGNDPAGSSGPDRIRLRAAEHVFQTYTSAEDFGAYGDNNTRLFIGNNGNIAMGSTVSSARLELYNTAGSNFLRLTIPGTGSFNDLNTYADGTLQIKSSNNTVHIGDSTSTNQMLIVGSISTSATTGTLRFVQSGSINYIQSGLNYSTGSAADLFIGNMNHSFSASSRKIIFKGNGKVGFGTTNPDLALEINDSLGNCLRLTNNDSDGSASNYCDITVSSNGITTFNTVGSNSSFTFTGGNINGTIGTASQPNITSLGTLTSLNLSGAITGITNLTMSGTLSGVNTINATNISGLLTTANQTNITGLGIISNLRVDNNLKIGTPSSAAEDFIHIESSSNSFVGIQIENRNSTAETSGCKLSFMGYRDINNAYEVTRIASVTTTSDAPSIYQYGALAFYTRNNYLDSTLTERMRINNSGLIGINTNNPTERLHVNGNILTNGTITNTDNIVTSAIVYATNGFGTASGRVTMSSTDIGLSHWSATGGGNRSELVTYSNGTITGIGSYNDFPFTLYVNNNERLRVANNGNIGIRTTNPIGFLDFGQNASDSIINLFTNVSTNETYKFGASNSLIKYQAGTSAGHAWYNNSTTISTGTERMRLTGSGFLGIGTSSPSAILTVQRTTNNPYIRWTDGTTLAETWINSSGVPSIGTSSNHGLGFYTNGGSSTQLFLDPGTSKNVGINTNTPAYRLDVAGTTKVTQLLVGDSTDNASNRIISALNSAITTGNTRNFICLGKASSSNNQAEISFNWVADGSGTNYLSLGMHSSSNTLNITGNGFVGVGVTNPSYKLDVSGNLRLGTNLVVSSDIYAGTYVYTASTSTAGRYVGDWTGTGYWGIGPNGSNELRIGTCSSSSGTWTGYANFVAGRLLMPVDGYGLSHRNGPSGTTELITTVGSSYTAIGSYSNTNLEFYVNNAWKFMLNTSDQMIRPVGFSTTISATSDIRLKENIITADLNLCYNKIKNLRLVHYKWKDFVIEKNKTDENNFDKSKLGWIAQEVQSVIPRAININKNNEFNIDDCLSIDTEHIYINLYGCTKKLIEDKENLENENIKLNTKIDEMEEVISDLYEQVDNLNSTVTELKELINKLINK